MRRGTVIVYHAVGDCPPGSDPENLFVPPARFEEQMRHLAERHEVVPLERIVHGKGTSDSVAITFDDGYRSVLTNAAPVLERYGFPATVFVPTRWVGEPTTPWYSPSGCDTAVMTEDELKAAVAAGVEVGSHGHEHTDLSKATPAQVDADLEASIERLTAVLGPTPRYLAYPWGRFSPYAKEQAAHRFEAAFSIDEPHDGLWAFERVGVTALDGKAVFSLKASGRYLALRRSRLGSGGYRLVRPIVRRMRRVRG